MQRIFVLHSFRDLFGCLMSCFVLETTLWSAVVIVDVFAFVILV